MSGITDLADSYSSCYLSLVDGLQWDDKLVTNCLDLSNPSPTRNRGEAIIVPTQTPRFMYP